MTKAEIIDQLIPFDDDTIVVIRDISRDKLISFESMKYGFLDDYGALFIDIN